MIWKTDKHSSDASDPNPVTTTPTGEKSEAPEGAAEAEEAAAPLEKELAEAKAECEQWRDRFLRKAAEFENYRKRSERERSESTILAKGAVLMELLPVMDAFERALGSFEKAEGDGLDQYREGVELLYRQLSGTLRRLGVVPIETEGHAFDPHVHEAISREITSEVKENTITRELRRGYLYRDRLLRPAQVIVAVHPDKSGDSSES